MQVLPIDLTVIIAVIMGISVVLVPVIGLTARFALKPTVEALARIFETRGTDASVQILERRMGLLETQIETLETSMRRLEEASHFDSELRAGQQSDQGRLPRGAAGP